MHPLYRYNNEENYTSAHIVIANKWPPQQGVKTKVSETTKNKIILAGRATSRYHRTLTQKIVLGRV
jgi:hypothetical protein